MKHHLPRLLTVMILMTAFLVLPEATEAHRSGCHRWHSCPSDTGSYVCGDLGYDDYCPNKPTNPPQPAPAPAPAPSEGNAAAEPISSTRPALDWQTYPTSASFQGYWQHNGGLAVFGYAKTPLYYEQGRVSQVFERNRLELHPEKQSPYTVQLGLLGEERLLQLGRVWQNEPQAPPQANCRFFAETGHNLCEPFLSYWRSHGLEFDGKPGTCEPESLALFGYPITEAVPEIGADGVSRLTQWFQRARFEDHGSEGI